MSNQQWTIGSFSDLKRVGSDPEMSDMSNPSGDIFAEIWYLTLVDERGYRFIGPIIGEADRATIELCEDGLRQAVANGLDPRTSSDWREGTPVYGSTAYVESGAEENLIAWEQEQNSWPF